MFLFMEIFHSPSSKVIYEMSPRSKDTVIGFGERMASKLMTAVLRDQAGLFVLPLKCHPLTPQ